MARLSVAIVREYERGVVFRLGKIRKVRDPGIRFMIPLADNMLKVSLCTITKPIQSQQIIARRLKYPWRRRRRRCGWCRVQRRLGTHECRTGAWAPGGSAQWWPESPVCFPDDGRH